MAVLASGCNGPTNLEKTVNSDNQRPIPAKSAEPVQSSGPATLSEVEARAQDLRHSYKNETLRSGADMYTTEVPESLETGFYRVVVEYPPEKQGEFGSCGIAGRVELKPGCKVSLVEILPDDEDYKPIEPRLSDYKVSP